MRTSKIPPLKLLALSIIFLQLCTKCIVWGVGDLYNIRRKNLNLEASNDAFERIVIFISGDEGAVESRVLTL